MSSKNSNKRNDREESIQNDKTSTRKNEKHTSMSLSSSNSHTRLNKVKGKQVDKSYEHIQIARDSIARLKSKFSGASNSKSTVEDIMEGRRYNSVDYELLSLDLPPPTSEFYDHSFLDMVSKIIRKHLQEEEEEEKEDLYNNKHDDESRVEQSRKYTQRISPDIDPLIDYTSSNDLFMSSSFKTYQEEQLIDCTIDFDSIVLDNVSDTPFVVEKEASFIKDKQQVTKDLSIKHTNDLPNNDAPVVLDDSSNNIWSKKDYISWLCFDTESEIEKFKDDCGSVSFFNQDGPDYLLEIENILDGSGFVSPIEEILKEVPLTKVKDTRDINTRHRIVTENIKSDVKEQDENNRVDDDKHNKKAHAVLKENSNSSIDIEKCIVNMSTPKEKTSKYVSFKRTLSERDEDEFVNFKPSPPLIHFPPRKKM